MCKMVFAHVGTIGNEESPRRHLDTVNALLDILRITVRQCAGPICEFELHFRGLIHFSYQAQAREI